eukprot:14728_1
MNHSINILLWITYTLFTLLYVNVNGMCGATNTLGACASCYAQSVCENPMNGGINGCGCLWLTDPLADPPCVATTRDPTIDPTVDPTVNPSETPRNSPSKLPSNSPSKSPT